MITHIDVDKDNYSKEDVLELLDYINDLEVEIEQLNFQVENPE